MILLSNDFTNTLQHFETCLKDLLDHYLLSCTALQYPEDPNDFLKASLAEAMQYSVLNGGKRLRPLLVYATGSALSIPPHTLNAAAMAVELIHCYSLIHDDLPAMDNDSLRRGKPTCHIAFNEATAILAGDALQSLAIEILTDPHFNPVSDTTKIAMIAALTQAIGAKGMVGGQAFDMAATTIPNHVKYPETTAHSSLRTNPHSMIAPTNISVSILSMIHRKKTGALIKNAVQLACLAGNIHKTLTEQFLLFADHLGLAFQVQDDILDVEGSTTLLGKNPGQDVALNKQTYPALLGLTQAKEYAQELYHNALSVLKRIEDSSDTSQRIETAKLVELSEIFLNRSY